MKYVFTISTNNYSGYTGDVTYYPSTGGTINIGLVTLPYDYITDYYYGTYDIYFPETAVTCTITNPSPPSPTTVYDIDVSNSNLYFANNVLTHNK